MNRPRSKDSVRPGPALLAACALFLAILLPAFVPRAAYGQAGTIEGKVLDDKNGQPLGFMNVLVVGTPLGALTKADGTFSIKNVPVGTYTVQASCIGYTPETAQVTVGAGLIASVEFRLKDTIVKKEKEVVVTAKRPLVEVGKASTTRSFNEDELKTLTVQPTLDSVVEQQPGVTRDNNEIHIRGGRSDETLYIVDGVQMRDLLSGDSKGSNVSARSVAEVNIITGGFDARYGQALSGVIEARLKEGGESYKGWLGVQTDAVVGNRQSDLWEGEFGGPFGLLGKMLHPLGAADQSKPTFYANVGIDFENGFLPAIDDVPGNKKLRSSYHESIFGADRRYGSFFYPRANNDWRVLFKTSWKASTRHKFSMSMTKSLSFDQGFNDSDPSEVNRNVGHYPWSYGALSGIGYGFDRYYTVTKDLNSLSLSWNQSLRRDFLHTLKVTRFFSGNHSDVRGLNWAQYNVAVSDTILPADQNRPYFKDAGDATGYSDRFVSTWSLDSDWIRKWKKHDIRWGLHSQYETVQYLSLDAATVDTVRVNNPNYRPLGTEFDLFKVYPNTGALYVQDRLEHEGLIASIGLRYDYWFPGAQAERAYREKSRPTFNDQTERDWLASTHSLFGHRYKGHLSPRIQVSHPITDHDNLFFNYGQFTQRPPYFYVYSRLQSQPGQQFPRIGNPNLNPEISVQYELGAGHQFPNDMAAKVSLFYKDIYDYPTSVTVETATSGRSSYFVYYNRDYARSRGLELELRKRSGTHAAWGAAYTYSTSKGKSSDPNQLALVRAVGGDARETNLDEGFMWWNRPHKLTLSFNYNLPAGDRSGRLLGLKLPDDLSCNAYYMLQSGRAYSPEDALGNPTGSDYSRNGPIETTLDGTITKGFRLAGRRLEASVRAYNLFDYRTVLLIDPATGRGYRIGEGSLAGSRETIEYLTNRYSDPSMRSAPRYVRLGLGVEL